MDLEDKYKSLNHNYTELVDSYKTLYRDYMDLKTNYTILEDKYESLREKYDTVIKEKKALEEQVMDLENKNRNLTTMLNKVLEERRSLEKQVGTLKEEKQALVEKIKEISWRLNTAIKWLVGNITYYNELVNQLKNEKTMLEEELAKYKEWLKNNITYYENIIGNLNKDYRELIEQLEEYKTKIEQIYVATHLVSASQEERDEFLVEAVKAGETIDFGEYSGEELFIELFKWIQSSMYYQLDPYILVKGDTGWYKWDNLWKLPNETIANEGGDCEDLALLVYSVLKSKGYDTWLLVGAGYESAHVAVLVKYNNKWYIIDPAGDWLNNYGLYIKLSVEDVSGKKWWYYINPLDINPRIKHQMLEERIASTIWWSYSYNDEVGYPYFSPTNINQLLEQWNKHWEYQWQKYYLIDIGLEKEFTNTQDLVDYLTQH